MKSIDGYLLREPEKKKLCYFIGEWIYEGDDYKPEYSSLPLSVLSKLNLNCYEFKKLVSDGNAKISEVSS